MIPGQWNHSLPIIFTFEILEAPRYYSNVYSETQVHNKLNGGISD